MSWMDSGSLKDTESFLRLTAFRESLVANNIANIDTPKYRTRDIDFNAELRRAQMTPASPSEPAVKEVQGLLERPDGNNVDMDREALLLAQTQLQYSLGVQLLKEQFKDLLTAIREGQ
jgi:flagellar basal-body rod protein FlgB